MIIDLDIEQLRQLCSSLSSACDELQDASRLLQRTQEHNNWGCSERVTINENSSEIRAAAMQLQQGGAAFSTAVVSTVDQFEAAEREISAMFGEVDGLLAGLLSAGPASSGGGKNSNIPNISDLLPTGDEADVGTYDFANVLGDLHRVTLGDLNLGGDK